MAFYTCTTGTTGYSSYVPGITGSTYFQKHAEYISYDLAATGDTVSQCNTIRIGPDGLQN